MIMKIKIKNKKKQYFLYDKDKKKLKHFPVQGEGIFFSYKRDLCYLS